MIAASVVVPCFNQLEFTRHCLRALFRHTRPPWELIVVDNGSTDGTGMYLAGVQDSSTMPVTLIANHTNRGFPAAVNQGPSVARGEYLVLLNNDAVVTDCWLDQLIALVNAEGGLNKEVQEGQEEESKQGKFRRSLGLVGPMSNYATPPQMVENVPYRDTEEMQTFAARWCEEHRDQWFTAGKISGFCMLIKRDVYETVGGLDERFGLGLFDDDDLAIRARRAGFELAVAHDLFIHHFGSRTFQGNGIDAEKRLHENSRRFSEKWGSAAIGQSVSLRPWPESGNGPQMTQMGADSRTRPGNSREGIEGLHERTHPVTSSDLRSSATSADKSSRAFVSLTINREGRGGEPSSLPRVGPWSVRRDRGRGHGLEGSDAGDR